MHCATKGMVSQFYESVNKISDMGTTPRIADFFKDIRKIPNHAGKYHG